MRYSSYDSISKATEDNKFPPLYFCSSCIKFFLIYSETSHIQNSILEYVSNSETNTLPFVLTWPLWELLFYTVESPPFQKNYETVSGPQFRESAETIWQKFENHYLSYTVNISAKLTVTCSSGIWNFLHKRNCLYWNVSEKFSSS